MSEKKELRRLFKEKRSLMSKDERAQLDGLITQRFLQSAEYKACEMLLCFVSTNIEVSTRAILKKAFAEKNVLCPRCEGSPADGIMRFCKVSSFDELCTGTMGILEPAADRPFEKVFNNALCVLPGLAFDRKGYRLGFGGGYYDRFLVDFSGIKAGICYESCVCDELAHNGHDIKADMLFTDKMIYRFSE